MSFRTLSSDSAERCAGLGESALAGAQRRTQEQLGHAQDAVHRRADFMAHIGQELRFCTARFLRLAREGTGLYVATSSAAVLLATLASSVDCALSTWLRYSRKRASMVSKEFASSRISSGP